MGKLISKILILTLFVTSSIGYSQKGLYSDNNVKVELLKIKKPSGFSNTVLRQVSQKSGEGFLIMAKCEISQEKGFRIDLSDFSLVDETSKKRYHIIDYLGYKGFIGFPDTPEYDVIPVSDFDNNTSTDIGYFKSKIDGYDNVLLPLNFGNTKKPNYKLKAFGQTNYKNRFKAELFFGVGGKYKKGNYNLYYKDVLVKYL